MYGRGEVCIRNFRDARPNWDCLVSQVSSCHQRAALTSENQPHSQAKSTRRFIPLRKPLQKGPQGRLLDNLLCRTHFPSFLSPVARPYLQTCLFRMVLTCECGAGQMAGFGAPSLSLSGKRTLESTRSAQHTCLPSKW